MFLHAEGHEDHRQFADPIPGGIQFGDRPQRTRELLGEPDMHGVSGSEWDKWYRATWSLHVQYGGQGGGIDIGHLDDVGSGSASGLILPAALEWRARMPKKPEKVTLNRDFTFEKETDLNEQIAAFRAEHEAAHHQILAMDARRSLGPGKVRVTFRVIEKKQGRR